MDERENMIQGGTGTDDVRIPRRILAAVLSSVSAGIVPRTGAPYIAIGRREEIAALLGDLEKINDGGAAMRFLIGRYGSGKTFLIQLIRGYALERGFITADADLSPERRLSSSSGGGAATYRELVRNLASKSSPEGGALPQMIARWLTGLQTEIASEGTPVGTDAFEAELGRRIYAIVRELEDEVGGFDFASVLHLYYRAERGGDDAKKSACLRWLRGEFSTKTEARAALGIPVSTVIDDGNWYDFIKLLAVFVRKIGYRGLVVFIDECVNLYKITNRVSRETNYEKILSMFNDTLGGRARGLMIVFGGTPQFLEDPRRGLFSYEALHSRLSDSRYASGEFVNLIGPVIRLRRLSDDELLALIVRLTKLHGQYHGWTPRVTEEEMTAFLRRALSRTGSELMVTPREIIRDYLTALDILYQNEAVTFAALALADGANASETASAVSGDAERAPAPAAEAGEDETPQRRDYTLSDLEF